MYLLQMDNPGMMNFVIIGLMFLIFYFFIIRPQMKKQKEEKSYQEELTTGSWVVTSGGIHGRISEVSENTVTLETSAGKIKIERSAISSELSKTRYSENKK